MTKDKALKMAIVWMEKYHQMHIIEMEVGERWIDLSMAIQTCKEALERPTNMVAVPADQLEKMQQELKQLRDEHKKWQGFARRTS